MGVWQGGNIWYYYFFYVSYNQHVFMYNILLNYFSFIFNYKYGYLFWINSLSTDKTCHDIFIVLYLFYYSDSVTYILPILNFII